MPSSGYYKAKRDKKKKKDFLEKMEIENSINKASEERIKPKSKLEKIKENEHENTLRKSKTHSKESSTSNLKKKISEKFEDTINTRLPSSINKDKRFDLKKNPVGYLNNFLERYNCMMMDHFGDDEYQKQLMYDENFRRLNQPRNKEEYLLGLVKIIFFFLKIFSRK